MVSRALSTSWERASFGRPGRSFLTVFQSSWPASLISSLSVAIPVALEPINLACGFSGTRARTGMTSQSMVMRGQGRRRR